MSDLAWIDAALISARPKAMAALTRRFRDLDAAEEAYQEACLRALAKWPLQGPPRDPAAWLILVARNSGVDAIRRRAKETDLPDDATFSSTDDVETPLIEGIDHADYADDILRLLFVCCHPDLPASGSIPLALRIVCGMSVTQIARAFLVGEKAMEQRITRAKARVAAADVPFDAPGPVERAERLGRVAAMAYLVFNEGYSAIGAHARDRELLCAEAIRLARLLLRLFPREPEIMGLLALMLLQNSRSRARLDEHGEIVLLEAQDRAKWDDRMIAEGLSLVDKAARHRSPGSYQIQAGIAALHARARTADGTDWTTIEQLYGLLDQVQPSPVVALNRAVAILKVSGPQAALDAIGPLAADLDSYFYYHGLRGSLLRELGRADEARVALGAAMALAGSVREAAHIRTQLDGLAASARGLG
jgi:RNA polymerase sigma-70 factor (ECF subfamily)